MRIIILSIEQAVLGSVLLVLGILSLLPATRDKYVLSRRYELFLDLLISAVLVQEAVPWYLPRLGSFYTWFVATHGSYHAAVAFLCVALALTLFLLKKKARAIYAQLEIFIGLMGLFAYPLPPALTSPPLPATVVAWILGGMSLIYLLVRGLDNLDIALGQRRDRTREASRQAMLLDK